MEGQMIHDWLVLSPAPRVRKYVKRWLCLCTSCNTDYIVLQESLTNGRSKRCKACASSARTQWSTAESKRLATYKQGARLRGYDYHLTNIQAVGLMRGDCYYCAGEGFGIDRVDNTQGYTEDNCVSCCTQCNRGKMDSSIEEFMEWIHRVAKNNPT